MRKLIISTSMAVLALTGIVYADVSVSAQADSVYTNGKIYTVDEDNPWAESYSGSLEVGKRADLIIIDRNLFEIPEDDIAEAKVLKTFLNGKAVYVAD